MAGRLKQTGRPLALGALVLAVVAVHGCVTQGLAERLADAGAAAGMPARMEVAYVRELAPSLPMPVVAAAALPAAVVPAPSRAARAAAKPAKAAASAPAEPFAEPMAEAAPERLAEAEPPTPTEPVPVPPPPASSANAAAALADAAPPSGTFAEAPAGVAPLADVPPFVWPTATRLRYILTGNYRGEINGNAQVEWVRQGARYQAHIDITVGLPFAPLMTRRMSSEGRITEAGLQPERYDEDSKVAFRDRRRASMRFGEDEVLMPDGRRLPSLPALQDTASQFVQMTWMFTTRPELLTPGGTVELALALPRNIDRWVYDVLAPETLATPFGAVETFHLVPRRVARAGSDLTAEVWFAPAYRHLPVRIRIRQDADTFIDLVVDRPPQLAP